ncbi:hypothetical protein PENANT_c007G07186 [Penicillium antarcticum]|uniref:RING-type domain-containing protein n=1 Tax=Penicillium antarcticum TaxID=416450 RepID=A0A1V6QBI2_9EURO|nr:uncharacterized protein N7508_003428 [Penicillium antarcticum]KAJ5312598.1 hypothetical protein N7508_003428 [Penicillium antarcticum]OQD86569.1 hypothetical protein PENANT_c007G07186 [Penicillium antarcticum]
MDSIQMPPPPHSLILYAPPRFNRFQSLGLGMSGSPSLPSLPEGPKRTPTPREMSEESDGPTSADWNEHFHPPQPRPQPLSIHLPRFPGDGLDYRRPVRPTNNSEVVDLTRESESPPQTRSVDLTLSTPPQSRTSLRFPQDILHVPRTNAQREVIDVDAEPTSDPADASSSSSDVQFVGATTRPRPLEPRPYNDIWSHMSRIAARPELPQRRPTRNWYSGSRYADGEEFQSMSIGDLLPVGLDYGLTGFSITPSFPAPTSQESSRGSSHSEAYKSPEPAPEGFTRTLSDYDVAICPNCHEELGVGEGPKGQIYVSKKCGHVYCGECAENRSKSKAKKSGSQTKPFSKCQIAGCETSLSSPTALFHLFL